MCHHWFVFGSRLRAVKDEELLDNSDDSEMDYGEGEEEMLNASYEEEEAYYEMEGMMDQDDEMIAEEEEGW